MKLRVLFLRSKARSTKHGTPFEDSQKEMVLYESRKAVHSNRVVDSIDIKLQVVIH